MLVPKYNFFIAPRTIFDERVFGKPFTNLIVSGRRLFPKYFVVSSFNSSLRWSFISYSSLITTKQVNTSPLIGWGVPITAASITEGCRIS